MKEKCKRREMGKALPLVLLAVVVGGAAVLLSMMMLFGTRGECLLLRSEDGEGDGDPSSLLLF